MKRYVLISDNVCIMKDDWEDSFLELYEEGFFIIDTKEKLSFNNYKWEKIIETKNILVFIF